MKKLLPLALMMAFIGSCTFRQEVNFNKDWSGDMVCVIDMSEMATLLESTGDPTDIMEEESSKSKISQLKNIPGIKKVRMKETDKGIYRITYSFKNLTALNKSGSVLFSDEKEPVDFNYFQLQDDKTLYFTLPFQNASAEETSPDDNSMAENFVYELTLSFPWKISKIDTQSGASLSADKKSVFFKSDILTLTSGNFQPGMLISFEK